MAHLLGESETAARHIIETRDAERRRLLKTHYQIDSSDPELYDMVMNTEHLSPKSIAKILVSMIKESGS